MHTQTITIDGQPYLMALNNRCFTMACRALNFEYISQIKSEIEQLIARRIDFDEDGQPISVEQEVSIREFEVLCALAFAGLQEGARKSNKRLNITLEDVEEKVMNDADNFAAVVKLYVNTSAHDLQPTADTEKK